MTIDKLGELRDRMTPAETNVVDAIFDEAFLVANVERVPLENCDGAARVEIAIRQWIIDSRTLAKKHKYES